jgi:hypothetical protein
MKNEYKTNEEIKEQYFDGKNLFIVTRSKDLKWHLYNHTKNKEILTTDDWHKIRDKMKSGEHIGD